jgi:uncharacterized protein
MADLPRCRPATWKDVDAWADTVAAAVRASGAVPETIVGLTRGGWVPSRLLADRLGVRRMVSLRAQHWGVTATPTGAAQVTEGLSGPVSGQRVLVADDITDTGESLALAVAQVEAQQPARVESATFLHIEQSKYRPTYTGEVIPREGWVWIVFPWNYWEDLVQLAQRAAEQGGAGVGAIRRTLKERCGLEVPVADLEQVARWAKGD